MRIEFPVMRTTHVYMEVSRNKLGSIWEMFHGLCDNKPALSINPSSYEYNATILPIKNHHASCEATVYITPFKNCQKWSVISPETPEDFTPSDNSNSILDMSQNEKITSPIYRLGKYYVIVGNTAMRTETIKDHMFYEIDVPKGNQKAPQDFTLPTKFYLETTKSVSFYLNKIENPTHVIKRVSKQCAGSEKNTGFLKLFSLHCVYSNYIRSRNSFTN